MSRAHLLFLLARMARSLWFTPAVFATLALMVLAVAPMAARVLPVNAMARIGLAGVEDLLGVMANSLLAVSIFSLGIMASSMQAAASAATPRARPLLLEDRTAQNAISTFLGGFIFSIVGIVGLSTDYYGDASRVLLFLMTCVVILAVILALIRWIAKLGTLGDVSAVIDLVEATAAGSLAELARDPYLGGAPSAGPPPGAVPIYADRLGFVQSIDAATLGELGADLDLDIHLSARPGAYVDPARPLVLATRALDDQARARLRAAFVIGGQRSFEADPRFALIVLSEIASRALSPGINDPGTAIDVVGTAVRLLADWATAARHAAPKLRHPRLHVPPLPVDDLVGDAFRWIARDGATMLEVQIRLQKGLATLVTCDEARFGVAARALSAEALDRAARAMDLPADVERLRAVAAPLNP